MKYYNTFSKSAENDTKNAENEATSKENGFSLHPEIEFESNTHYEIFPDSHLLFEPIDLPKDDMGTILDLSDGSGQDFNGSGKNQTSLLSWEGDLEPTNLEQDIAHPNLDTFYTFERVEGTDCTCEVKCKLGKCEKQATGMDMNLDLIAMSDAMCVELAEVDDICLRTQHVKCEPTENHDSLDIGFDVNRDVQTMKDVVYVKLESADAHTSANVMKCAAINS